MTVAIEGHLEPTTAPMDVAITTLWRALRILPMGPEQHGMYEWLLGKGASERVERMLDRDGPVRLTVGLPDDEYTSVRIWRGDGRSLGQQAADRYEPRQLDGGHWGVWDRRSSELVTDDDGEVQVFSDRAGAQSWVRAEVYHAGYGHVRA